MTEKAIKRTSRGAGEHRKSLTCVIVLPTRDELLSVTPYFRDAVKKFGLRQTAEYQGGINVYTDPALPEYSVGVVSDAEMGNVGAAVTAAFVLGRYAPQLIISAGIAGSLDPRRAWIGDVLMPSTVEYLAITKIYGSPDDVKDDDKTIQIKGHDMHTARLITRVKPLDNHNVVSRLSLELIRDAVASSSSDFLRYESALKEIAKEVGKLYPDTKKVAHRGPTADWGMCTFSWEKVQNSSQFHKYLVENKSINEKPLCVEMESWGFARMSERLAGITQHESLVVRAISDIVGAKHVTDKLEYRDVKGHLGSQGLCRTQAMASLGSALGEIVRQHRQPELV